MKEIQRTLENLKLEPSDNSNRVVNSNKIGQVGDTRGDDRSADWTRPKEGKMVSFSEEETIGKARQNYLLEQILTVS